jgi:hypothetical protein
MPGIILTILAIFLAICFALHRTDYPLDSSVHALLNIKPKKKKELPKHRIIHKDS